MIGCKTYFCLDLVLCTPWDSKQLAKWIVNLGAQIVDLGTGIYDFSAHFIDLGTIIYDLGAPDMDSDASF